MVRRGGIRIVVALALAIALAEATLAAQGLSPVRRMAVAEPAPGLAELWSRVQEWVAALWTLAPADSTDPTTCDQGPKVDPNGCPGGGAAGEQSP